MDVTLPREFDELIRSRVESGRYRSPAEVVGEALRLLEERDRLREDLRKEIQAGIDELDRGDSAPLDMNEIWAEVEALVAAEREAV